jgi:hypothetical protein
MISVVYSIVSDMQRIHVITFAKINLRYILSFESEKIRKTLTS